MKVAEDDKRREREERERVERENQKMKSDFNEKSREFDRKIEDRRRANQINAINSEEAMRQRMKEVNDSVETERAENLRREKIQREKMINEQNEAQRTLEKIREESSR